MIFFKYGRATVAAFGLSILSGCTTWQIDVKVAPDAPMPVQRATPNNALPRAFANSLPYMNIYAETRKVENSGVDLCASDFWTAAFKEKQQLITVTANPDILSGAPGHDVPLLVLTQNNNHDCEKSYNHAYIAPWFQVGDSFYSMGIRSLAQDKSKEKVSKYFSAISDFAVTSLAAGGIAASGGAIAVAGPALTDLSTFLTSKAANAVSAAIADEFQSNYDEFQSMPIHQQGSSDYRDSDQILNVFAIKSDTHFNPTDDKPVHIADITVRQRWTRTVIGHDSGAGITFEPGLKYEDIQVVMYRQGQAAAQNQSISSFVPLSFLDSVRSLTEDSPEQAVIAACSSFRSQLSQFNKLDREAILATAYFRSRLALNGMHRSSDGSTYACLAKETIDALDGMGLKMAKTTPAS